jgi:hypothetical protein
MHGFQFPGRRRSARAAADPSLFDTLRAPLRRNCGRGDRIAIYPFLLAIATCVRPIAPIRQYLFLKFEHRIDFAADAYNRKGNYTALNSPSNYCLGRK